MESIVKGTVAALPEIASDTLKRSAELGPLQTDLRGLMVVGAVGIISLLIAYLLSNDTDSKKVGG